MMLLVKPFPFWLSLCLLLFLEFHSIIASNLNPTYVVEAGDDLWSISQKLDISLNSLEACNPQIRNPALIHPGDILSLPQTGTVTYTVLPGDNLYEIAAKFHVSLQSLETDNPQITNPNLIHPGQVINIQSAPGSSCGQVPASSSSHPNTVSASTTTKGFVTSPPVTHSTGISTTPPGVTSSAGDVVVIGGSTYTLTGQSAVTAGGTTYTLTEVTSVITVLGQTYSVSNGEIIVSSKTISLPEPDTTAEVITSNGITLTILPESSIPPPITTGPSTSATLAIIGTSTLVVGTAKTTLTDNGQTFVIGAGGITVDSSTITLPAGVTGTTALTIDGITASLEPTSLPDFGAVPPSVSAMIPLAGAAVAQFQSAFSKIESLAAISNPDVGGILGVESLLMNIVGVFEALQTELGRIDLNSLGAELKSQIQYFVDNISNFTRDLLQVLSGMKNLIKSPVPLNKFYQRLLVVVAGVAVVVNLLLALVLSFKGLPPTTTSTSSSLASSYYLVYPTIGVSAADTALLQANLVEEIGVLNVAAEQFGKDPVEWWVIFADVKQVALIEFNSIVRAIEPNILISIPMPDVTDTIAKRGILPQERKVVHPKDWKGSRSPDNESNARLIRRDNGFTRQQNAPLQVVLMSEPQNAMPLPNDYIYADEGGEGITVYVVDSGVDPRAFPVGVIESSMEGGLALPQSSSSIVAADPSGHGTCVASIIVDAVFGVAKNAKLSVVRLGDFPTDVNKYPMSSILDGLRRVLKDIKGKNKQGKAVVNLSIGGSIVNQTLPVSTPLLTKVSIFTGLNTPEGNLVVTGSVFSNILSDIINEGVVIVASSGNSANAKTPMPFISTYPQLFAGTLPIINVGSTDPLNKRSLFSQGGPLLAVSTLGEHIQCRRPDGSTVPPLSTQGTSFSCPAIAGLAAYFLSLPNSPAPAGWPRTSTGSSLVRDMKAHILSLGFPRVSGGPLMAWNGVDESTCGISPLSKRGDGKIGKRADFCGTPSISGTSTSTIPPTPTCGPPLSCESGHCAGTMDNSTSATCKQNFAGCECLPSIFTPGFSCGAQESCERGGCAGTMDNSTSATCKADFAGCQCLPSIFTPGFSCGAEESCQAQDCNGAVVNGVATCQDAFAGCPCIPCPSQSCTAPGCNGNAQAPAGFGTGFGTCTSGPNTGCACVIEAAPPPPPAQTVTNGCSVCILPFGSNDPFCTPIPGCVPPATTTMMTTPTTPPTTEPSSVVCKYGECTGIAEHEFESGCLCICNDGNAFGPPGSALPGSLCDPAVNDALGQVDEGILCALFPLPFCPPP